MSCHTDIEFDSSKSPLVYKDECCYCFETMAVNVCLECCQGFCEDHLILHNEKTNHTVYLAIKKIIDEQKPEKITKIEVKEDPENMSFEYSLKCFGCKSELEVSDPVLNQRVNYIVEATEAQKKSKIESWEQKVFPCEHASNLVQTPSLADGDKCSKCELEQNLWLCLTCGSKGCGREQYDGSGGRGHGKLHFEETGHPISCKLGTISADGTADCHCYSCDEMILDPNLTEHLAACGIILESQRKTEKSLNEMQLEYNEAFEFNMVTADGESLQVVTGSGFRGLKNIGNSCYLASIIIALFHIHDLKNELLESTHILQCKRSPSTCFACQSIKLAFGVYSEKELSISPWMFKATVSKNTEFDNARQQDSFEFFQLLLKKMLDAERFEELKGITLLFNFNVNQLLECQSCKKCRLSTVEYDNLSLNVGKEPTSLEDCLLSFTQKASVDFTCPICGPSKATTQSTLESFPSVLVLRLNKFELDNYVPKKLNTLVKIPSELNLSIIQTQDTEIDFLPETPIPDEILMQLMSMGFEKDKIENAFSECQMTEDVNVLMNWLFENPQEETALQNLIQIGISKTLARKALQATGNNFEAALEFVMNPSTENTQYTLFSVVSHKGSSTNCGHYICHTKIDDRWIMFNDDRVAIDSEPSFDNAYVLIFVRESLGVPGKLARPPMMGFLKYMFSTSVKRITKTELAKMIESGSNYEIIDVREPSECKEGMIPTAKNIPYSTFFRLLETDSQELPDDLVLYCYAGPRASRMAYEAEQRGKNVLLYYGGWSEWCY